MNELVRRVILLGIGAGGSIMAPYIARFTNYLESMWELILIDGDSYEYKNQRNQIFDDLDNKALVQKRMLNESFPKVDVQAIPEYVTQDNISDAIDDGSYVFLAVDNHATRKLISGFCETLDNVTLISGGIGELTKGHVQVHIRRNGVNLTPPISFLHPEIQNPKDYNPGEDPDCLHTMTESEPQLLFTSVNTSSYMLAAFYTVLKLEKEGKLEEFPYSELYVDIFSAKLRTEKRSMGRKGADKWMTGVIFLSEETNSFTAGIFRRSRMR